MFARAFVFEYFSKAATPLPILLDVATTRSSATENGPRDAMYETKILPTAA